MAEPDAFAPPSSSVNDLDPDGSPVGHDEPELPEPEIWTGRQKAGAAVMEVDPPEMLAKLCNGLKKGHGRIVENIRGHYAVPSGTQPDGILSDEYRAGMKRAAAKISRSQYEIYSFSDRRYLPKAATDELLRLLNNVSSVQL